MLTGTVIISRRGFRGGEGRYDGPVLRARLVLPPEDRAEWRQPTKSLGGRLALGGLAALALAVPFTLLALLVLGHWHPLAQLDARIADDLNSYARVRPHLVDVLRILANVLDPWVFRSVVLGVSAWLWRRDARRLAIWAMTTTVIGGVLGTALKVVVSRARPALEQPVAHSSGYSFPSGHAVNSFLCTGVLILVFLPVLSRAGRWLAYVLGAAIVLLTGFDRVALGVHYVSDVVAGWIIALACLAGTAGAFEVWRREHGRPESTPSEGVDPDAADEMSDPHQGAPGTSPRRSRTSRDAAQFESRSRP
jgi:membrane-associated phospholipid phosphatase